MLYVYMSMETTILNSGTKQFNANAIVNAQCISANRAEQVSRGT